MEITVQVQDEQEALLMMTGLQDESIKAFVSVIGALKRMPDLEKPEGYALPFPFDKDAQRKQVLHAVCCLYGCDK